MVFIETPGLNVEWLTLMDVIKFYLLVGLLYGIFVEAMTLAIRHFSPKDPGEDGDAGVNADVD